MSATVLSTFFRGFRRVAAGLAASLALGVLSAHAQAQPTPFPADFRSSQVVIADATINVRVGGHGPAAATTSGRRPATSAPSSTSSASTAPTSWATTSA